MERAGELARAICRGSCEVHRHVKALTGRAARPAERAGRIRAELERFEQHLRGSDLRKGLAAFRAKQDPNF